MTFRLFLAMMLAVLGLHSMISGESCITSADMIVTTENPLEDLRALRNPEIVIARGTIIEHPKIKKRKQVEMELDRFL